MLRNRYLKYSPEITPEIFTLVWDRLKSMFPNATIYDWVKTYNFDTFKRHGYISIWGSGKCCFGINNNTGVGNDSETTVQEILGYDPFVKEFVLPEKWCIKCTPESKESLNKWTGFSWTYTYIYFDGKRKAWSKDFYDKCVEITFEQFKKYVLKESIDTSKEVIPEYVECIIDTWSDNDSNLGKIFKVDGIEKDSAYVNGCCVYGSNSWQRNFKPSTKEAFDAQNKPKSIEKWSVGSYVVFYKESSYYMPIGTIDKITECINSSEFTYCENYGPLSIDRETRGEIKWFATKSEAEEFAKKLVESVKHNNGILDAVEVKQAVHCTTQEEWDFVTEKLGYKWANYSKWSSYLNSTCINLNKPGFGTADVAYTGYQILSFREWCDLNGYKMEKEVKFEVGKWYKLNFKSQPSNYLLKCIKLNEKSFYYSQYIILDKSKLSNSKVSYGPYSIDMIGDVVPIEEIQQYLPNGHPDKIKPINSLADMSITELHEKGLIKDFFYEVIGESDIEDALDKDDDLCEFSEFEAKNCALMSCSNCLLHRDNKSKLADLLKPNKPKESSDFKVGDCIVIISKGLTTLKEGQITTITSTSDGKIMTPELDKKYPDKTGWLNSSQIRHATSEEINNYLISIGKSTTFITNLQMGVVVKESFYGALGGHLYRDRSTDDLSNYGLPTEPPSYMYEMKLEHSVSNPKLILSIDDEELPMVSIIKTNTIKQLLNNN